MQSAPTALASLLLGGDEQSLRLERTTKQPLPSSPGSCVLWLSAGGEVKLLWQGLQEPPSAPGPTLAPAVPLAPGSCSVGLWGHTLYLYPMQPTFSPPTALRSPPPLGGVSQASLALTRGHSPTSEDPCPSRIFFLHPLLASSLFCPSP